MVGEKPEIGNVVISGTHKKLTGRQFTERHGPERLRGKGLKGKKQPRADQRPGLVTEWYLHKWHVFVRGWWKDKGAGTAPNSSSGGAHTEQGRGRGGGNGLQRKENYKGGQFLR